MACPANSKASLYEFFAEEVQALPQHVQPLIHLCNAVNIYSKCDLVCPIQTRPNGCLGNIENRRNFYRMLKVLDWARDHKYMARTQFEVITTHLWGDKTFISKMRNGTTKDELQSVIAEKWNKLNMLLL